MHQRKYRMIKRHDRLKFDPKRKNFKEKLEYFSHFFPFPYIYICLLSLETGVSEKLSLKIPSDVVKGSARATFSVLGESPSPRQATVHLITPVHAASPSMVSEDFGCKHWVERKSAKLRIALYISQDGVKEMLCYFLYLDVLKRVKSVISLCPYLQRLARW